MHLGTLDQERHVTIGREQLGRALVGDEREGAGRPGFGEWLDGDLDAAVVVDEHALGEVDVCEVVLGDLVRDAVRRDIGGGDEVREPLTDREEGCLVEDESPARRTCGEGARWVMPRRPAKVAGCMFEP